MNEAKSNPSRAQRFEATCLMGDRLTFSNQVSRTVFLQLLGQVYLCGCLFNDGALDLDCSLDDELESNGDLLRRGLDISDIMV